MTAVILCGGSGTRLFPISRELMPKQFASLFEGDSLFQRTVKRNAPLCEKTLIVCNTEHYFLALDQLEAIGFEADRVLIEPVGRNTAPAIALAALCASQNEPLLVVPSDHLIDDQDGTYSEAIKAAQKEALEGYLVAFGIKPTYPETGYGYIKARGNIVKAFKEKPNREQAQELIAREEVYWNSGMFCFTAGAYLQALADHAPKLLEQIKAAFETAKIDEKTIRISREKMSAIDEISVDYAAMEKAKNIRVVSCAAKWSDMGSFESLYNELPKDDLGNAGKAIYIDSKNNLVIGSSRQISLIDCEDIMAIDASDALLIAKKGSGQKAREVVKALKAQGSELPKVHSIAHRPWGTYEVLDTGDRFKIKRIVVKAGKRLSLQKHFHRNEHWIVLSGAALVTLEDKVCQINANESIYIHAGCAHRLENPGKIDLVIIEAQVGDYLGEDDIVRIEDDFKRDQ
ncbi:MAG: mannose-1-phosphate guanylyltransferase/mannose-6-phosphate isomerase [Helicobacteraceae bacterium]|jgi:mannose-1-phosphate guanylyltransferase|nr:mannose-1-phosphate guanylyltransferase/mannose-6-phosphate isomerase [Helicobacteraceae bacterium]